MWDSVYRCTAYRLGEDTTLSPFEFSLSGFDLAGPGFPLDLGPIFFFGSSESESNFDLSLSAVDLDDESRFSSFLILVSGEAGFLLQQERIKGAFVNDGTQHCNVFLPKKWELCMLNKNMFFDI